VLLATVATIIASQAIITGSFSLTRQAMQLGWFPGLRIRQTSDEEYGHIYVPFVNWTMMLFPIALTVGYGRSDRLAGAYGTAVSTTMLLTTALIYKLMRDRWGWSATSALLTSGVFLIVDFAFFAPNLLKIVEGGWIPLTFGAIVYIVMTTWHSGIEASRLRLVTMTEPPEQFLERLEANRIPRAGHGHLSNPDRARDPAADDPTRSSNRRAAANSDRPHGEVRGDSTRVPYKPARTETNL
jgi:KUP system potassium uptake protein